MMSVRTVDSQTEYPRRLIEMLKAQETNVEVLYSRRIAACAGRADAAKQPNRRDGSESSKKTNEVL